MANEQTSVPLYAASEVLTAANMNISAGTGVPVFATTVTRDAAFGGANEKVLAEGQLCYLSSTNVVQYYDGAAWATVGPAGATKIGQVVSTNLPTTFTTTSTSYTDITGLSVSITPTLNTSKVFVIVNFYGSLSGLIFSGYRLMRDSTAIDIGDAASARTRASAAYVDQGSATVGPISLNFLDSPATTSATTYKMQMLVSSGTGYVNRTGEDADSAGRPRLAANITVMEVVV